MNTMRRNISIFVSATSLIIASCEPGQLFGSTWTPSPTVTPTPTATATSTSTPTPIPTPTITPTLSFVESLATLLPESLATPLPENQSGLKDFQSFLLSNFRKLPRVAQWGYGHLLTLRYVEEKDWVVLLYDSGVFIYEYPNLNLINVLPIQVNLSDSTFGDGGAYGFDEGYYELSKNGEFLVVSNQNHAQVWSLETGKLQQDISLKGKGCPIPFIDPASSRLMLLDHLCYSSVGYYINEAILYDLGTGKKLLKTEAEDAAFSPDGKLLITGSNKSREFHLWDTNTGEHLMTLTGPDEMGCTKSFRAQETSWTTPTFIGLTNDNSCVVFSPDSQYVVTSTQRGTIVWNVKTGESEANLPPAGRVIFASDGRYLVINLFDHTVIYETTNFSQVWSTASTPGQDPLFSPSGKFIVTGQLILKDTENFRTILNLNGYDRVIFSENEEFLFAWTSEWVPAKETLLIRSEDGEILARFGLEEVVGITPDSTHFITSHKGKVYVRTFANPEGVNIFDGYLPWVTSDNQSIIVLDRNRLRVIDLSSMKIQKNVEIPFATTRVEFLGNAPMLMESSNYGVRLLDLVNLNDQYFPAGTTFTADGTKAAIPQVEMVEIADLQKNITQSLQIGTFKDAVLSPNGDYIAITDDSKKLSLWEVASGEKLVDLNTDRKNIFSVQFSPDGTELFAQVKAPSANKLYHILGWQIPDGTRFMYKAVECEEIMPITHSLNGRYTLYSDGDCTITVHDKNNGQPGNSFNPYFRLGPFEILGKVDAVLSPDGQMVVTSNVGRITLWDTPSGEQIIDIVENKDAFSFVSVSFSSNGQYLAVAGNQGVQIFKLR